MRWSGMAADRCPVLPGQSRKSPVLQQIEYDTTCMSERIGVRLRSLPHGDFRGGFQVGLSGRLLKLALPGQERDWPPKTLLEIECGSMLYLGELQSWCGPDTATVVVEHSLDRVKLAAIQETGG